MRPLIKTVFHLIPAVIVFIIFFFLYLLDVRMENFFYLFILIGFCAQIIDGSLGMGFGMVNTAVMLGFGINPAIISSSVHTAELFSTAASGLSHYKFGNIHKKIFLSLLIPGTLGSIAGALLLVRLAGINTALLKIVIALYTAILGIRLIFLFLSKKKTMAKSVAPSVSQNTSKLKVLAVAGGFLDAFGGGGWGPIVTTTLIGKGHAPRYVIGSVNAAEFFVTFASAVTFFMTFGLAHWHTAFALAIGGTVAAPVAAKITSRVTARALTLAVGVLVILWSVYALIKVF